MPELRWINGLSLDWKLAWRLLKRSPSLTGISMLGLALGTAVSIGFFVAFYTFFYPRLPLHEGDRVVALENWDVAASKEARRSLHDFLTWREELRLVQPIAAASMGSRELVTGDAPPRPVRAADMTAAGFQIGRVPPLLGRYLGPEDEHEGAPCIAVIGYDLWQAHFGGDPSVVGRSVLLGNAECAIVGVMPTGFALPENQEIWTALRASPARHERDKGPELFVFGRLVPGATRERAQAEITALGRRAAAAFPETNAHLRPKIVPYTYPLTNIRALPLWQAAQIQLMVNLLLVAIAVNIAVLVYARTAMRQGEIAVRTALGASRGRIVGQLFVEALLLSILGTGLGVGLAYAALSQLDTIFDPQGSPFWNDYGLQPRLVAYALGLALLCSVIVGVVPALRSTGRTLRAGLQGLGSGVSVRLGWTWTTLIVAQVASAVSILPTAVHLGYNQIRTAAVHPVFPAHDFLTAGLGLAIPLRPGMDADSYRRETAARFADRLPELERRLEAEFTVAGITFEGNVPGHGSLIEVERLAGNAESRARRVMSTGVATDYLELLGARILAGRAFRASDVNESGRGLVVSQSFVRRLLGDGPALGRRVRFLSQPEAGQEPEQGVRGPWQEIVGVIEDLEVSAFDREIAPPTVYYPVAPGDLMSANLLVRTRGLRADEFTPRLRQLTAALDPDFRLGSVENLATVRNPRYLATMVTALLLVLGTVLLVSAAGIHALMSFTVTCRHKEIGLRMALGARPSRLLASIFSRAAWQLGLGGILGSLVGSALLYATGPTGREAAAYLGGVVLLTLGVGLLATLGPARRVLRIEPREALRAE